MRQKTAPPHRVGEAEGTHAGLPPQSIASERRSANTGRSPEHPTYYRVGTYFGDAVYWHPQTGVSVEVDHQYLAKLDANDPDILFDPSFELIEALALNPRLADALPDSLSDALDDISFAERCRREFAAVVQEANPGLIPPFIDDTELQGHVAWLEQATGRAL